MLPRLRVYAYGQKLERVFSFFSSSKVDDRRHRGSMLCDKVEAYCLSRRIDSCSVSDESASRSTTVGSMCVKRNLPTRQSGWKKSNWNEVVCLVSFFVSCRSLAQINILFRPKLYHARCDASFRLFTVLIFIFSAIYRKKIKEELVLHNNFSSRDCTNNL